MYRCDLASLQWHLMLDSQHAVIERYEALRGLKRSLAGASRAECACRCERALNDWNAGRALDSDLDAFTFGYLANHIATHGDSASPLDRIVGETRAMQELRQRVRTFATSGLPVMIIGERGSGKGLVARAAHACRRAPIETFFPVHCAAVPAALAESQMFGHFKGAFTGAHTTRAGVIATAFGCAGTLFFDDVPELTPEVQPKLLQAIEDRVFFPVGSDRPTVLRDDDHRALHVWSAAQPESLSHLRSDLVDRLCTIVLLIPPLRDRPLDILLLADVEAGQATLTFGARAALLEFDWPGNVRQLRNVITRARLSRPDGAMVDADHICSAIDVERNLERLTSPRRATPAVVRSFETRSATLKDMERDHILHALNSTSGNVSRAAQMLGLKRSTLQSRLRTMGHGRC